MISLWSSILWMQSSSAVRMSSTKHDRTENTNLCEQLQHFTEYTTFHGVQFVGKRHSHSARRYVIHIYDSNPYTTMFKEWHPFCADMFKMHYPLNISIIIIKIDRKVLTMAE